MDVMSRTCVIIDNVQKDLCTWSPDGTTAQKQSVKRLPGEQGQEEAQVTQVRHVHQYLHWG